ncbi:MAG: amidohydrolase family protein, partial [Dehalococcoidia bacterium]|nr:amidohydrolase family protein [Dehalococcoidia bacterium]
MAPSSDADLVLCNANVLTMDRGKPRAALVAVKDGRVLGLGAPDDVSTFCGPSSRVIDCQGRTIVPGFNDAHCHFFSLVRRLLSIDSSPASVHSISGIVETIKASAARTQPGNWITAVGYDESRLTEKRHPARQDLDKATTTHPVRLLHRTGRACVLNTLALSMASIGSETEDPPGGLIDREIGSGEPTGLLFQMNGLLESIIPPLAEEELHRGVRLANHLNLSRGITTFQDASVTNDISQWQAFQRLKERGDIRSRISMMPGFEALDQFTASGLAFRSGDQHLRLGAVKIVVDRTTGRLNPTQEELTRQVLQANRAGFQVALHAIEEEDIEAALTALDVSRAQGAGRG